MANAFKHVQVPHLGRTVCLVPREKMRRRPTARKFSLVPSFAVPVPTAWDGSKGRSIVYPILGNDTEGDCYYADGLHCVQTWTGNVATEAQFDAATVLARYEVISGGDNGLDDATIFAEWKGGLVGPNGLHKILDDMTVDPNDDVAIRAAMFYFCGGSWTAALPDAWVNIAAPGVVWDTGTPDPNNGHAMHLSGYDPTYLFPETWGFDQAVKLTSAGRKSADPEVTVQFSLDMFDPATGIAPSNGMGYDDLAALWVQCGGATLPPNPFNNVPPPPSPTPTPNVQQIVDAAFAVQVQKYHRNRAVVSALRTSQPYIDAVLSGTGLKRRALPPDVMVLLDQLLVDAEGAYPQYTIEIMVVKAILDKLLG